MNKYIIKKLKDVNENELLNFYKVVYNKRVHIFLKNYKWFYRFNFSNLQPIVIYSNNEIIAHAGLIPNNLILNKKIYQSIWFTDFVVLPEYRKKGFGKIITEAWMNICPNHITFCNNQSLKIFKKLNWQDNYLVKRYIDPMFLQKLSGKNLFYKKKEFSELNIIKINKSVIDDLIKVEAKKIDNNVVTIFRDENWFNWRLLECPFLSDIICFELDGEYLIGHIFKRGNYKIMNIIYTSSDNFEESKMNRLLKIWAIKNSIYYLWKIRHKNFVKKNFINYFLEKKVNFAFNSNKIELLASLNKGLINAQGIDGDVDFVNSLNIS